MTMTWQRPGSRLSYTVCSTLGEYVLVRDAIWVEARAEEETEAHRLMNSIMSKAGRPFLDLKVNFSD